MNVKKYPAIFLIIIYVLMVPIVALAATDQEARWGATIQDRLWLNSVFPLGWSIHEDGAINNDVNGFGNPDLTAAQVQPALQNAFDAWENVGSATISFNYLGTTANGTTGCDQENIITWSDNVFTGNTVARGITTYYFGPQLILNDVNRLTVNCSSGVNAALPLAEYPNGITLTTGTILDMDLAYNSNIFDFVLAPDANARVVDVQGYSTHEIGHMSSLGHTSLVSVGAANQPTMYPAVSSSNPVTQSGIRTLNTDEIIALSQRYPGPAFWPTGTAPYNTGAITGNVYQADGTLVEGIRVWAFEEGDLNNGYAEVFTYTDHDWDNVNHPAGSYQISGLPAGKYYVCIVPWNNNYPNIYVSDESDPSGNRFSRTATDFSIDGFSTESYDDVISPDPGPLFNARVRKVEVKNGETTPNINFVLGQQETDIVLVMDRSGSMTLPSGTPGINKLLALQNAANGFIDYIELDGGHRLGLVQFEEALVPLTPVFDLQELVAGNLVDAHDAVNTMNVGGMTNIIAGVEEGIHQLTDVPLPNKKQSIVVFSDGKHNRPLGSDLNVIHDQIIDNDIRFYSIGFGTDVDEDTLSTVAHDSGGTHVNENNLNVLDLKKNFLSIAASAVDDAVMVDPRFKLGAGEKASIDVAISKEDKDLKFAINWTTKNTDMVGVTIITPGGCKINKDFEQLEFRTGDTHELIKIDLPFKCRGRQEHEGVWKLIVTRNHKGAPDKEEVDLIAFGGSLTRLFAKSNVTSEGVFLAAKLVSNGRIVKDAIITANVTYQGRSDKSSEQEDRFPGKFGERKIYERKKNRQRSFKVELSKVVNMSKALNLTNKSSQKSWMGGKGKLQKVTKNGTYKVHLKASYREKDRNLTRELITSFTIK